VYEYSVVNYQSCIRVAGIFSRLGKEKKKAFGNSFPPSTVYIYKLWQNPLKYATICCFHWLSPGPFSRSTQHDEEYSIRILYNIPYHIASFSFFVRPPPLSSICSYRIYISNNRCWNISSHYIYIMWRGLHPSGGHVFFSISTDSCTSHYIYIRHIIYI